MTFFTKSPRQKAVSHIIRTLRKRGVSHGSGTVLRDYLIRRVDDKVLWNSKIITAPPLPFTQNLLVRFGNLLIKQELM